MMRNIINILLFPLKCIALLLIYLYKFLISPLLPKTCIYTPSCSTYAIMAIKKHGVIDGTILAIKRIGRCSPHHKGGLDEVPLSIKGDDKWLY